VSMRCRRGIKRKKDLYITCWNSPAGPAAASIDMRAFIPESSATRSGENPIGSEPGLPADIPSMPPRLIFPIPAARAATLPPPEAGEGVLFVSVSVDGGEGGFVSWSPMVSFASLWEGGGDGSEGTEAHSTVEVAADDDEGGESDNTFLADSGRFPATNFGGAALASFSLAFIIASRSFTVMGLGSSSPILSILHRELVLL